jgi:FAD/FMN-containing dehydrogenase
MPHLPKSVILSASFGYMRGSEEMAQLTLAGANGTQATLTDADVNAFAKGLKGQVLKPDSAGYNEARSIWNAMIDKHPSLIVRCTSTEDVVNSVRFAKSHGLLVAIRGGGHNIAGNASCDGGMVIDLSQMKAVKVDVANMTATSQPGVTLADYDQATQEHGLATPLGINSTTGIAGLTLGGGFGWISRKFGLTIDNLLEAEVVTATGEVLKASETENPDLFWGIRGGGGNFGVVTSFKYRLHKVGPQILSGLIVHPMSEAKNLLQFYREFTKTLPDDVTVWVVMRKAPPLPFLPTEWHGKEVLVFAAACAGDPKAGEEALKPLREFGKPIADVIGMNPFAGWQQAFDPLLTPGMRNYWKSNDFNDLPDGYIDAIIDAIDKLPSPHTEIFIGQMGGATSRVAPDATAYRDRNVKFIMNVHGRWETAGEDKDCVAWCRGIFDASTPFSTGGVYVNFLTSEEGDRIKAAYGPGYDKLVELKRKYDPTNLFSINQNIKP